MKVSQNGTFFFHLTFKHLRWVTATHGELDFSWMCTSPTRSNCVMVTLPWCWRSIWEGLQHTTTQHSRSTVGTVWSFTTAPMWVWKLHERCRSSHSTKVMTDTLNVWFFAKHILHSLLLMGDRFQNPIVGFCKQECCQILYYDACLKWMRMGWLEILLIYLQEYALVSFNYHLDFDSVV